MHPAYLAVVLFTIASPRRVWLPLANIDGVDRIYVFPSGRLVAYGPSGKLVDIRLANLADALNVARKAVAPFPQYVHDCKACTFVGRSQDGTADLYHCKATDSALGRMGDEPDEYLSMPASIALILPVSSYTREAADLICRHSQVGAA